MKKMWMRLQRLVKEEKGLTLIELLAVIVILGIIAAIAVPAITGITNNTKREAHKANAHQMIEAAKQMVAIDSSLKFDDTITKDNDIDSTKGEVITLGELKSANYFPEGIKDPTGTAGSTYNETESVVTVTKSSSGVYSYFITLAGGSGTSITYYYKGIKDTKVDSTAPSN